jgi:sialate O-acetylesterase
MGSLPGQVIKAGDVLAGIPEAREYALVYDMDLAGLAKDIRYNVDNHAKLKMKFDRVAYLVELKTSGGQDQYVFVSFKAVTDDVGKTGIPTKQSGARFQQAVDSMNVYSNVSGVKNGKGMKGHIEFWPNNYGGKNARGVRHASNNYDWGDEMTRPEDGYGSMQVHNPDARHVIFVINNWKAKKQADLGIGNSTGKNQDWTFTKTAGSYPKKRLRVFIRPKR